MSIVAWVVVGLVAGLIAKALMPGNEPGKFLLRSLSGIAGAFVGGAIAIALGISDGTRLGVST